MQLEGASARSELEGLYFAAVAAVHPERLLPSLVADTGDRLSIADPAGRRVWLVPDDRQVAVFGAGKGAGLLAAALEELLGQRIAGGLVIVPEGYARRLARVKLVVAGHPLPDERGELATRCLLSEVAKLAPSVPVIVLVTGGASSLLAAPVPGVSLADKSALTRLLLTSGAAIEEINAVRKHLSSVKGGRLGWLLGGRLWVALVVSDVMGDDPAVVGSGPTVPDPTTFADAVAVLRRYRLWERAARPVREYLSRGLAGEVPETPKPVPSAGRSPAGGSGLVITLATNDTAREAAAQAARSRGLLVVDMGCVLRGDTAAAARRFMREVMDKLPGSSVGGPAVLLVAGGETTVEVRGAGKGGRNQEFALVAAPSLARVPQVALLSAGSDGIDGPTDAAGAFADGTTLARAAKLGIDWRVSLARNDSYGFFAALGDLFQPGPTGVNVMDLKLVLAGYPPR